VASRIKGACFTDFDDDQQRLHKLALSKRKLLSHGGLFKYVHGGEYHAYNHDVIQTLQKAVRSGQYSNYSEYAKRVNTRPITTLRDMLALKIPEQGISIDDVEPAEKFYKRFDLAAMSIGALSPEAHEALM
jgi:glutamate synthase (NADPH/NADH) large chain